MFFRGGYKNVNATNLGTYHNKNNFKFNSLRKKMAKTTKKESLKSLIKIKGGGRCDY